MVNELFIYGVDTGSDGRNEALYLAAGEGHEDTVQMLVNNGADVNAKDWIGSTALDWAALEEDGTSAPTKWVQFKFKGCVRKY